MPRSRQCSVERAVLGLAELGAQLVLEVRHRAPGRLAQQVALLGRHAELGRALLELHRVAPGIDGDVDELLGQVEVAVVVDADLGDRRSTALPDPLGGPRSRPRPPTSTISPGGEHQVGELAHRAPAPGTRQNQIGGIEHHGMRVTHRDAPPDPRMQDRSLMSFPTKATSSATSSRSAIHCSSTAILSSHPCTHSSPSLRHRAATTGFCSFEITNIADPGAPEHLDAQAVGAVAAHRLGAILVGDDPVVGEHAVEVEHQGPNRCETVGVDGPVEPTAEPASPCEIVIVVDLERSRRRHLGHDHPTEEPMACRSEADGPHDVDRAVLGELGAEILTPEPARHVVVDPFRRSVRIDRPEELVRARRREGRVGTCLAHCGHGPVDVVGSGERRGALQPGR